MAALAHSHDAEPIDPAEEPMSEAAFEIIQRAHAICNHAPAVDLTVDLGNSELSNAKHVSLLPHAIKIMSAQFRAGELLAEMKERGASDLADAVREVNETDEVPAADAWWRSESWTKAAEDYHTKCGKRRTIVEIEPEKLRRLRALLDDDVSLQRAYGEISPSHIKGRAADSTVEALLYGLRSGVSALKEPDVRRRLSQLSDDQLVEVGAKLRRRGPEIGGAWTANEIQTLMQLRETLR
jgi:hypothetical protein